MTKNVKINRHIFIPVKLFHITFRVTVQRSSQYSVSKQNLDRCISLSLPQQVQSKAQQTGKNTLVCDFQLFMSVLISYVVVQ